MKNIQLPFSPIHSLGRAGLLGLVALAGAAAPPAQTPAAFPNGVVYSLKPVFHELMFPSMASLHPLESIDTWGPFIHPWIGSTTAIWHGKIGGAWVSHSFLTAKGYQAFYANWTRLGFRPHRVCAAGNGEDRYACILVKDGMSAYGRHGQTEPGYLAEELTARANGYMLDCLSVHGSDLFATVWVKNPTNIEWKLIRGLPESVYKPQYELLKLAGYSPVFTTPHKDDNRYYTIMRKGVTNKWRHYRGVAFADHAAKVATNIADGFRPLHIATNGNIFCGVWVQ